MTNQEIIAALLKASRSDLRNIRLYMDWIRLRRRVNNHFYRQAHWIQEPSCARRAHWV
jgi:hypothetical protein